MHFSRNIGVCGLCLAAVVLAGCGGGPAYPAAKLAGTVTINGQEAPAGKVNFLPEAGNPGQAVAAEITGGRYSAARVPRGKVRVMFSITVDSGEFDKSYSQPVPIPKNLVPEKYWPGIVIDVSADNSSQNFELVSGAP